MRLLVLQHIPVEHPGVFRDFLKEDGVDWDVVELDGGEPIPSLAGYDALWVMGGPMDVWEEESSPEVGILDVELTPAGRSDPLLAGLPQGFKCLQWHGAEVVKPPTDAAVLASSPACAVQALRVGENAYGLQYHVELTASTVSEWAQVSAYKQSLERVLGANALPRLDAEARLRMPGFNRDARRFYDNFMALCAS
jgi:GMP synthase-like glutamine amidotransferase